MDDLPALVLGAGPAGLSATLALHRAGIRAEVVERDSRVGGLTRTEERQGFRFDLGGHRFYTKKPEVSDFVRELLGDDLLTVPRLSRIHYRGRFVDYPIRPLNALRHVGPVTCLAILRDLLRSRLARRRAEPDSLQAWMLAAYGPTLYQTYFKVYAEKVWGLPADRIDAGLAAQRVKGLDLLDTLRNAIFPRSRAATESLVERFSYPRLGYGQICDRMAASLHAGALRLSTMPVRVAHDGHRIRSVTLRAADGFVEEVAPEQVISSIPITSLLGLLDPPPPLAIQQAARALGYRAVVFVAVFIDRPTVRPESWIYFPSPAISFGRIVEPRNWSAAMAPAGKTSVVAEHFCDFGDATWTCDDSRLVLRTIDDLAGRLRFFDRREVLGSAVVRAPRAYPRMDVDHRRHLAVIEPWLDRFANLQCVGRAGLYRYHNADHAIETGLLAARSVIDRDAQAARHAVRAVNAELVYHETRRTA